MQDKGLLIVISGPSGSGKGTIVSKLIQNEDYGLSISATTRAARQGEIEGKHYFFKTKDEFKNMIKKGELLEHAEFCGNLYGTPLKYVEEQLEKGQNIILEIDVQGALQIKQKYEGAILIFIIPNDIDELRSRLWDRATEDSEDIDKRMKTAISEVKMAKEYDYLVINDILDDAILNISKILDVEKMKTKLSENLIKKFLKEN